MKNNLVVTEHAGPLAVIATADLAETTKRAYSGAMERYLEAAGDPLDARALEAYAQGLSNSSKAHLSAAIRLYTKAIRRRMDNTANPNAENAQEIEARMGQAERKLRAVNEAVKVRASKGEKVHTWLSRAEVMALLDTVGDGVKGHRDRLALGLLVAAGLRRSEAVGLRFEDVKYQPVAGKMRAVLEVNGKGGKTRAVPISDSLAAAIDAWGNEVDGEGKILRSVTKGGAVNGSLSSTGLFNIVRAAGEEINKPDLAPHDLRRTFAQLGYEAGVPVTQISKLLGHASIKTTQRYLNLDLDLDSTVSDFVPF